MPPETIENGRLRNIEMDVRTNRDNLDAMVKRFDGFTERVEMHSEKHDATLASMQTSLAVIESRIVTLNCVDHETRLRDVETKGTRSAAVVGIVTMLFGAGAGAAIARLFGGHH